MNRAPADDPSAGESGESGMVGTEGPQREGNGEKGEDATWRHGLPDMERIKRSDVPPRQPIMRKGYWDSVVRDVSPLEGDKVLRLKFSDGYDVEGMTFSARKAAARAGIKVSIAVRGNLMYLWVAGRGGRPVPNKSAPASKE